MMQSFAVWLFICSSLMIYQVIRAAADDENRTDIKNKPSRNEMKTPVDMRSVTCLSPVALGMENYKIPDSAITASSFNYNQIDFYGPQLGRLNLYPLGPWIKHDDDTAPWIQVDLGDELSGIVTGLQTQGAGETAMTDKYVSAFKVRYGVERCNLNYVGAPTVFTATSSAVTTHTFPQPVQARIIRIEPTTYEEFCALRFEVFGCPARTTCGSGWNDRAGTCYFLDHNARVNYAQAQSACQSSYGAKLASIHSEDEQSFIGGNPECFTKKGSDYRGFVSITKNGNICQKWSSQSPNSHGVTPEKYPEAGLEDNNYCRNPDGEPGPWCYTMTPGVRWEVCDVGTPQTSCNAALVQQDSNSINNGYYFGLNDQTTEGVFKWTDGSTLDYSNWQSGEPNGGFDDCAAIWPHGEGGMWRDYRCDAENAYICKTSIGASSCPSGFEEFQGNCFFLNHDDRVTFSQAQVECQNRGAKLASIHSLGEQQFLAGDIECFTKSDGSDYRGHISTTTGGKTCQKWTSQSPHSHSRTPENYPNGGLGDHNYCRNPDGEPKAWCYTTESTRWEYCNVGTTRASCIVRIKKDPANVDDGYFIGLNDRAVAGAYVWSDGSAVDYINWQPGQPDNSGSDQDCVALWPKGGSTWRDYECSNQFPYVCEKKHELSLKGRTATQSSTNLGPANRAIDGGTSPVFSGNTCTQTGADQGAWWMVDQVFNECIGTVAIYTRQDCCKEKLEGAVVRVGPNSDRNNPVCGSPITLSQINADPIVEVSCNLRGRYISVSLPGSGPLNLCEVKAYLGVCNTGIDTSNLTPAVCSTPVKLGIENGQIISDALLTSSSYHSSTYTAKRGRLNDGYCWIAHRSEISPWIQVDLFETSSNAVSGVITQGNARYDEWVTLFSVQVGEQECSLLHIMGSDNTPKIFSANSDKSTEVTNMFPSTYRARYVRIYLVQWVEYPSLRFEVLGCRL